mmetsp:Transcript_74277/g.214676  ORF Transcript_74277/g.214676 Transcript_74277/m.214676 type:complete len:322 (+) Transcript_74277:75-1040(+)
MVRSTPAPAAPAAGIPPAVTRIGAFRGPATAAHDRHVLCSGLVRAVVPDDLISHSVVNAELVEGIAGTCRGAVEVQILVIDLTRVGPDEAEAGRLQVDDDAGGAPLRRAAAAAAAAAASAAGSALAAHAAGPPAPEGRGEGEVDVLLAVQAHEERRDVTDLLADADVALADQRAGVVNGLRQPKLEDLGLETPLHDLGRGQPEDIIELLLGLREQAQADHAAQQRLALEQALLALLIQREERARRGADLRHGVVDAPHLALVLQAVLADDLHLAIKALLLEGPLRLTEGLPDVLVTFLAHGSEGRRRRSGHVWKSAGGQLP